MREIIRKSTRKKALFRRSKGLLWLCLFFLPLMIGCTPEKRDEAPAMGESTVSAAEQKTTAPVGRERSLAEAPISAEMNSAPVTEAELRPEQTDGKRKEYIRSVYFEGNKNWIAPVFLLQSKAAVAANREIRERLQEITKDSAKAEKTRITYQFWAKDNILSVLIQAENGTEAETEFFGYNFDVTTGEKLTVDQLLQAAGMDWPTVTQIFDGERRAYWRAVADQNGRPAESYQLYYEREIKTLRSFYEEGQLAVILDEDKLINVLAFLRDEYGKPYWRLYCVTANRTALMQRNAYGGDFPAVVLADPSPEELANVKIIKKLLLPAGDKKKAYLLLPLWDGLRFEWGRKTTDPVRAGAEAKLLWASEELPGENTIYVELGAANGRTGQYYGVFRQYGEKSTFDPQAFQALSQEERGILYLPLR